MRKLASAENRVRLHRIEVQSGTKSGTKMGPFHTGISDQETPHPVRHPIGPRRSLQGAHRACRHHLRNDRVTATWPTGIVTRLRQASILPSGLLTLLEISRR